MDDYRSDQINDRQIMDDPYLEILSVYSAARCRWKTRLPETPTDYRMERFKESGNQGVCNSTRNLSFRASAPPLTSGWSLREPSTRMHGNATGRTHTLSNCLLS